MEKEIVVAKAKEIINNTRRGINHELFLKIAERLRNERIMSKVGYEQTSWCNIKATSSRNECGTTACIAGHVVLNEGFQPDEIRWLEDYGYHTTRSSSPTSDMARNLLGIDSAQAVRLFYKDARYWESPYKEIYSAAFSDDMRRKVAADYLEAIGKGDVIL